MKLIDAAKSGCNIALKEAMGKETLTSEVLNCALLNGQLHYMIRQLVEAGARPDKDTLLCFLYGGDVHHMLFDLLEEHGMSDMADLEASVDAINNSDFYHPKRLLLLEKVGKEGMHNSHNELEHTLRYAEENLKELAVAYGKDSTFSGLIRLIETRAMLKQWKTNHRSSFWLNTGNENETRSDVDTSENDSDVNEVESQGSASRQRSKSF